MDKRAYITNSLGRMLAKQAKTCFTAQVKSVEGETCTVEYEGLDISGVRLRPTTKGGQNKILVTPAVDTSILVGSLSGDLNNLCVLSADTADSVEIVCEDARSFIDNEKIELSSALTDSRDTGNTSVRVDREKMKITTGNTVITIKNEEISISCANADLKIDSGGIKIDCKGTNLMSTISDLISALSGELSYMSPEIGPFTGAYSTDTVKEFESIKSQFKNIFQ